MRREAVTGRRGGVGADHPDPPAGQAGSTPTHNQSRPQFFSIRVEDPGCLSQIPVPDFSPTRIPDPTSTIKRGGFFLSSLLLLPINLTKLEIIYF